MQEKQKDFYEFEAFRLEPRESLLLCNGSPIPLAPKVFELLLVLVENAGTLVEKEALLRQIWPDSFVEEGNLTKNIHLLRRILEQKGGSGQYIETVPKRGYRFTAAVRKFPTRLTAAPDADQAPVVPIAEARQGLWAQRGGALPAPIPAPSPVPRSVQAVSTERRSPWFWIIPALTLVALALAYRLRSTLPAPRVLRLVQLTHLGNVELDSRIVPDGERLYFIRQQGGRWELAQVSVHGGQAAAVPTPFPNAALYDISPDRSELLVGSFVPSQSGESTLWALPLPGGSPRSLGSGLASQAAWSPDGAQVYFSHRSEIDVVDRSGLNLSRFLNLPNSEPWTPAWDPRGRSIRFTVVDLKTFADSIWQATPSGSQLGRVLPGPSTSVEGAQACCGVWTPDGKYFLFKVWAAGSGVSIQAIQEKGRLFRRPQPDPVQLYSNPVLTFWHLSPSADGRTVFFPGMQEHWETLRLDPRLHLFVPFLAGTPARTIRFSRDGKWVLWLALDFTIWRSRADGSDPLQLTFTPMVAQCPRWSPTGDQILFNGWGPGGKGGLFLVPRDGGAVRVILAEEYSGEPAWSPNGRSVAFVRRSPTIGFGDAPRICVLDAVSGSTSELPNAVGLAHPIWSPDGRYLAAVTSDDSRLVLFDFQAQSWAELVRGDSVNLPVWSHDGRFIYFQNILNVADYPIFRVNIVDHRLEKVTTSKALNRAGLNSYGLIGLAPDDSPLVSLKTSSTDIYALDVDLP